MLVIAKLRLLGSSGLKKLTIDSSTISRNEGRSETMVGMEVCTAVRTASTVIMVFRVSRRCR